MSHETHPPAETHDEDAHHSDTVHLPGGRSVTLPGGIYTFVFLVLGALTVFELGVAEFLDGSILKLPLLLGASSIKAALVVIFYMHLNSDKPIYRFVIGIPLVVIIICAWFLLVVPPVAY